MIHLESQVLPDGKRKVVLTRTFTESETLLIGLIPTVPDPMPSIEAEMRVLREAEMSKFGNGFNDCTLFSKTLETRNSDPATSDSADIVVPHLTMIHICEFWPRLNADGEPAVRQETPPIMPSGPFVPEAATIPMMGEHEEEPRPGLPPLPLLAAELAAIINNAQQGQPVEERRLAAIVHDVNGTPHRYTFPEWAMRPQPASE